MVLKVAVWPRGMGCLLVSKARHQLRLLEVIPAGLQRLGMLLLPRRL